MKDFYYILGTEADCTFDEVKEAYRKLSKKFHPDLNPNDKYFEDRFREIQEAYETLVNPEKRVKYDAAFKKNKPQLSFEEEEILRRRAAAVKAKTRSIDIGFTSVLIILTLVFGIYVYRTVHDVKPKAVTGAQVATLVANKPIIVKHHRKRHFFKYKNLYTAPVVSSQNAVVNNTNTATVQPVINKPNGTKPALAAVTLQPAPAKIISVVNNEQEKPSYLYQTAVHSNVTGVINMRSQDKFSSEVISEIPTNARVYVLQKGDVYYKVAFNNSVGYVPKWTLINK